MPLKASIRKHVPAADVKNCAAREFRDYIDLGQLREPRYTVICYPGMRGESTSIVDSKTILKALAKIEAGLEPVVAIAYSFTSEALEVLDALNAIVFRRSDYFWSDESWAAVRDIN